MVDHMGPLHCQALTLNTKTSARMDHCDECGGLSNHFSLVSNFVPSQMNTLLIKFGFFFPGKFFKAGI